MNALHSLLVFLHVLSISVWMAAALWVAGDVKRALALGRTHLDALAATVRPKLGLDAAAGIATLVTGLLLMWEEGMTRPRVGITVGLVLTLGRMGLLAAVRRAWRSIAERLERGEAVPATDAAARRLGMLSGIAHTLWLIALAGMVFPV
ncbi:MAG TPA: hypothetical protein VF894_03380 [Anaeromyxobacter sp.]